MSSTPKYMDQTHIVSLKNIPVHYCSLEALGETWYCVPVFLCNSRTIALCWIILLSDPASLNQCTKQSRSQELHSSMAWLILQKKERSLGLNYSFKSINLVQKLGEMTSTFLSKPEYRNLYQQVYVCTRQHPHDWNWSFRRNKHSLWHLKMWSVNLSFFS